MHSPGLHSLLQQVHCICVFTREFGHSPVGVAGEGLASLPDLGKLPHVGASYDALILNEPPSGLVEDLSAMGQVEPNLDLIIAMLAQRELVDIEEGPQGPLNCTRLCFWAL